MPVGTGNMNLIVNRTAVFFGLMFLIGSMAGCYKPVANTSAEERDQPEAAITETRAESDSEMGNTSENVNKTETPSMDAPAPSAGGFRGNVEANLKRFGLDLTSVADESNPVQSRILREYGAVLLTTAAPPSKIMFTSESQVEAFQAKAEIGSGTLGGVTIELQREALSALQNAAEQAKAAGFTITPRDGQEAARRSYAKTLDLWNSRFLKACDHWTGKGRLSKAEADRLKSLPIGQQVEEVLEIEKKGIYFNTFFNNSILSSVAAPGTSQHISMLAFDASEYGNPAVRKILAENGWFRTVQNDEPHFTYLGRKESDLGPLGLKKVAKGSGEYWVPDL